MPFFPRTAALLLLSTVAIAPIAHADPAADLAKFSVFDGFDISKVSGGKVLSQRGPTLESPRDLGIQAVYLVEAPLAKVVQLQRSWDPSKHSGLKVVFHTDLPAKPTANDFAKLASLSGSGAVKNLASATQKLPEKGALQLSQAEAGEYAKTAPGGAAGAWPAQVANFWKSTLGARSQAWSAKGFGGQSPYEPAGIRAGDEAARLLKEQPKIRAQFQPLISSTPLGGGAGSLPSQNYVEIFDAENSGAIALGSTYTKEGGDTAQALDVQYYASGGYYAYFTLYQLWSVSVDGKPATLVWRGDSVASQALGELRGVEKMGSGAAMMKEVQKSIGAFQKDAR